MGFKFKGLLEVRGDFLGSKLAGTLGIVESFVALNTLRPKEETSADIVFVEAAEALASARRTVKRMVGDGKSRLPALRALQDAKMAVGLVFKLCGEPPAQAISLQQALMQIEQQFYD